MSPPRTDAGAVAAADVPVQAALPATAMSPSTVVLLLALLLGLQPVTTDLYLPALPALTEGFGAGPAQAQLTLSALLLAFGGSQLVWGPVSDRYGRRPVLLAGLAAYCVAAAGCALAESIAALTFWRVVQGAAMGAAVMGARAIVRDLYTPVQGARAMSRALTGLGVMACLSPIAGGWIADHFGWRHALASTGLFSAAVLALVFFRFEESVRERNPRSLQPAVMLATWRRVITHPTFVAYGALTIASYLGLFTFLAASSFVLIKVLGLSRTTYGWVMFSCSAAYITGTFLCRALLPRLGVQRTVAVGGVLSLVGGTTVGVLPWAGVQGLWAFLLPYWIFMLGHGIHQPCGQSGAVAPFPQAAGAASALNGFLMMVAAFFMGGWIGGRLDGTVFALTQGVWLWATVIATIAWTLVRWHGEPRSH